MYNIGYLGIVNSLKLAYYTQSALWKIRFAYFRLIIKGNKGVLRGS